MTVTPSGMFMSVRLSQYLNTPLSMHVTPLGITTLLRFLQPQNANSPMTVTPSGMFMSVRLVQFLNASLPMLVTLLGIATLLRLVQP